MKGEEKDKYVIAKAVARLREQWEWLSRKYSARQWRKLLSHKNMKNYVKGNSPCKHSMAELNLYITALTQEYQQHHSIKLRYFNYRTLLFIGVEKGIEAALNESREAQ